MGVEIDSNMCQGHGRCYVIAPDVFDMDDEGMGIVIDPDPGEDQATVIRNAVANCPESAISFNE